jgi:hypothetical protein
LDNSTKKGAEVLLNDKKFNEELNKKNKSGGTP